jgi:tetratricopeptide (TPR) repeat protein
VALTRVAVLVGLLVFAFSKESALQYASWFEDVLTWVTAVDQHEPGKRDAPLRQIRSWSPEQFDAAIPNLKAFLELASHPDDRTLRKPGRRFTKADINALASLVESWSTKISSRHLLERAALLHTDIALLPSREREAPSRPAWQPPNAPPRPPSTTRRSTILLIEDGQVDHVEEAALHWDLARALMDLVVDEPGRDDIVRSWYVATAAFMADRRHHAYSVPHLEHARLLFPKDPDVLYFSGCLSESLASPDIQNVVAKLGESNQTMTSVKSLNPTLDEAIAHFRKTLDARPDFPEARIRLGHVLAMRGRHREALVELQRGLEGATEKVLLYYGRLFLGRSQEALGQTENARRAYEAAASFFPRAQSPRLALSQLSRRAGNRAEAHRAIDEVLSLPASGADREDPWWSYYASAGRDVHDLFVDLHKHYRTDQ